MHETHPAAAAAQRHPRRRARNAGLSIVELLLALAISAMLLTATVAAVDASFQAYAAAASTASTQTSTRMVTQRLMQMVRTSTAHGPLTLADAQSIDAGATQVGDIVQANFIELIDADGQRLRVRHDATNDQLWMDRLNLTTGAVTDSQPVLDDVTAAVFYCNTRVDRQGVLVLERGSIDLTVMPDQDNTLSIEIDDLEPLRVIASTMPRRIGD